MTVVIQRLGRQDVPSMRQVNALFGTVFNDADSYASTLPSDTYLADLLAKDHFIAMAALDGNASWLALSRMSCQNSSKPDQRFTSTIWQLQSPIGGKASPGR